MASVDTVRTAASGLAQRLGDAFVDAPDHEPPLELRLGRATIHIEIAAGTAAMIMPALGVRLAPPTRNPDVTFRVFSDPGLDPLGQAVTTGTENPRVTAMVDPISGALSTWDADQRIGYFWCSGVESLPDWDFASPLRALFSWSLPQFGMHVIHGAAVGNDEGTGVLLAGASGRGKSTTALICAASGMRIIGDDYIVLDTSADALRARFLYDIVKLLPDSPACALLPDVDAVLVRADGKAHIQLSDVLAAQQIDVLNLKAIAVPQIAAQTGTPKQVSGQKTLLALAPGSILQLPGTQRDTFPALVRACRELPAYELEVGPDIDAIPAAVSKMLP
jgi:hypothetical protein